MIKGSKNVAFINNTVFDFGKYGIQILSSKNVSILSNKVSVISDTWLNETANSGL